MSNHHHHHSGGGGGSHYASGNSNSENPAGSSKKLNVVCKFFKSGKCLSGKSCKFLHDSNAADDSTNSSTNHNHNNHNNNNNTNHSNHNHNNHNNHNNHSNHSSPPVCKYHMNGYCKSGSKCPFQHIDNNNNTNTNSNGNNNTNGNNNNNGNSVSKKSIEVSSNPPPASTSMNTTIPSSPIQSPLAKQLQQQQVVPPLLVKSSMQDQYISSIMANGGSLVEQVSISQLPTLPIGSDSSFKSRSMFIDDNQQFHQQQFHQSSASNHLMQFQFDTSPRGDHIVSNPIATSTTPKSPLLHQQPLHQHQHSGVTNIALSPQQRISNALSFFPASPRAIISSSPSSPFSPQYGSHNATMLSSSPSPFYPLGGFQDPSGVDDDEASEDDDEDLIDFNDTGFNVIDDNYDDTVFDPFQFDLSKKFSDHLDIGIININKQQNNNPITTINNIVNTTNNQHVLNQQSSLSNILLNSQHPHSLPIYINNNNNNNNTFNNNNNSPKNNDIKHSISPNNHLILNNIDNNSVHNNNNNNNNNSELTSSSSSSSPNKYSINNDLEEKKPLSYLDALKSNLQLPPDYYITYENQPKTESSKTEALCHFFVQGSCRNGDSCKFIHGEKCQFCEKPMLVPNNHAQNKEHMTECMITQERAKERAKIKSLECGICFDSIVEKGRRFGLLSHCNHVFCLDCIREWRGSTTGPNGQVVTPAPHSNSNTSVRLCPMCRVNSYFIIPSDIYVSHEKKQEIIEIYRSKLGTIPCKYFNNGKGTCKFGTSCMYAHLNPDGSIHRPQVRKVQASYGDTTLHSNQLGMFLAPLIQQQQQQQQQQQRNRKIMSSSHEHDEDFDDQEEDQDEEYEEDE